MFKTYTHKNKTVQKHKGEGFLIDAEFSISNLGYQAFCFNFCQTYIKEV